MTPLLCIALGFVCFAAGCFVGWTFCWINAHGDKPEKRVEEKQGDGLLCPGCNPSGQWQRSDFGEHTCRECGEKFTVMNTKG